MVETPVKHLSKVVPSAHFSCTAKPDRSVIYGKHGARCPIKIDAAVNWKNFVLGFWKLQRS